MNESRRVTKRRVGSGDMTRRPASRAPGLVLAVATLLALAVIPSAPDARAANPPDGTVGPESPSLTWQGETYTGATVNGPEECPADDPDNETCDHFTLTVDVAASYWDTHEGGVDVTVQWTSPSDDIDLHVFDDQGNEVGRSTAAVSNFETVNIPNASGVYQVLVVPFRVAASDYTGTAAFLSEESAPGGDVDPGPYFFHGEPDDDANKAIDPTAFFDLEAPTDTIPASQSTTEVANTDFAQNPLTAFWTGAFSGTVDGSLELTWFWSSTAAVANGGSATVEVTVFADTGGPGVVDPDQIIGRRQLRLTVGPDPTENVSLVPVTGVVQQEMTIQVALLSTGTDDLRVFYDTPDLPSRFVVTDTQLPPGNVTPPGQDGLASADPQGLDFSATVPADIQRDEAEPLIEIDGDGNAYTCGPTGFSQVNDYAQVSTDGGDQFHLLGEPPRGQLSVAEGGGDCSLVPSHERNDQGEFQLAYTGLGPLTNFTAGTSADAGRTFVVSPVSESVPGVDRQWNTFLDADSVLLNYNQVVPRQVVVQRSDDGGLTYGPRVPATPVNPSFPGPMKTLPAEFNPDGTAAGPVAYFPWSDGTNINLALSTDGGANWRVCEAAEAPGEPTLFVVADHDRAGNIYLMFGEDAEFHTWVTVLAAEDLAGCNQKVVGLDPSPVVGNPGWSTPVQVDRGDVRSTVFAWLTAGGEPGRVAVTFYGAEQDGDPGALDFEGTWHVYVNQSLDRGASFSQVRATTHPNHYDQISLGGFEPTAPADRSMADFFAIDFNPANGELMVVYNQAHKRPGDVEGLVATPVVLHQIGGPSNGGGVVDSGEPPPLRSSSTDPIGDALADYSSLGPPAGTRTNVPAADITSHVVGPFVDLDTGQTVEGGGFTVTMTVDDLSDDALLDALAATKSQSLLWIFRYVDGYRYAGASARWNPLDGFTFGYNGFVTTGGDCTSASSGEEGNECLLYPGDIPIDGEVDRDAGTITLSVPLDLLEALEGDSPPIEVPAAPGDRIFDAAAFSVANPISATQDIQSFLYPLDNTPAMDFLIPEGDLEPDLGDRVTGGGWLEDGNGEKINFSIQVRDLTGSFKVNDKPEQVKIQVEEITSHGPVTEPCGSVPTSDTSTEVTGTGTFNGSEASFRVCVQDNADPGHSRATDTPDLFYLECVDGCVYNTGARTPDDTLDGGNLQVRHQGDPADHNQPQPTTLILEPVLLTEEVLGHTLTFTVKVFDQNQELMEGTPVSLSRTFADGTEEVFEEVITIGGEAVFDVLHLGETVFQAVAGTAESNTVEVSEIAP